MINKFDYTNNTFFRLLTALALILISKGFLLFVEPTLNTAFFSSFLITLLFWVLIIVFFVLTVCFNFPLSHIAERKYKEYLSEFSFHEIRTELYSDQLDYQSKVLIKKYLKEIQLIECCNECKDEENE